VVTDSPPMPGARNVSPTVVAVTAPVAYVRLHGRNAATWNKRGGAASERFDYLYSEAELREWVGPLRELAGEAEQAHALFNDTSQLPCASSGGRASRRPRAGPRPRRRRDRSGVARGRARPEPAARRALSSRPADPAARRRPLVRRAPRGLSRCRDVLRRPRRP